MLTDTGTASIVRRWQRNDAHQVWKDNAWASQKIGAMPDNWAGLLLKRWRDRRGTDTREANLSHLRACRKINAAARAGVPADANDAAIVQQAQLSARDMGRRLDGATKQAESDLIWPIDAGLWASMPGRWSVPAEVDGYTVRTADQVERLTMLGRCLEALHWLDGRGIADRFLTACAVGIPGALKRVVCETWWRKTLRVVHRKGVEATARTIGLVHMRAGCYVSDDTAKSHRGMKARNARILDSVVGVNERGEQFELSKLAAKGTSNPEIRRCELMTRIAGFELVAKDLEHEAIFVTLTCPSRMHAYRKRWNGKGVEQNPSFDGTTPDDAQKHLSKQWAKCRSAAARAGLDWYGVRIAEPNHDATPHWHCLLFFPKLAVFRRADTAVFQHQSPGASDSLATPRPIRGARAGAGRTRPGLRVAVRLLRRYFLWQVEGAERGARAHRVKVVKIDWAEGTAAGYIAKYISKNIDGHRVEKDLYGNPAMTSSQRVEAWASTWGVRQFQQIGGAPVGVWRELRRLNREQAEASELIAQGLEAVNITADRADPLTTDIDREQTAAHGWHGYTKLQGGPNVRRAGLRMRLQRDETGELGRYGELMAPRVVGVVTDGLEQVKTPAFGIVPESKTTRRIRRVVESERCSWVIVPKAGAPAAAARVLALLSSEAAQPRSPVNNCTRPDQHPVPLFAPSVQRVQKKGRFSSWGRGRLTTKADHDPQRPADRSP